MRCPKQKHIFNGLGKMIHGLMPIFPLMYHVFFKPYIFTSFTIPGKWYPLLFSISRIYMPVEPVESSLTVRTLLIVRLLIIFSTDLVNKGFLCHMVDVVTIGTKPCSWDPFPLSINGLDPIELHCLVITFGTFLLHETVSPQEIFVLELVG